MRQRKLFQLLMLFSLEDLDEFRAFLRNPAINSGKTLVMFYDIFREKVLSLPEDKDCTAEELLDGTEIKPQRMDKLSSRLHGLAQQFLAQQQFLRDEHAQMEMLTQAIEERDPGSKEAERLYDRMRTQLDSAPESSETLLNSLKLRWIRAEVAIKSRDTRALWQEDFRDLHQLLDAYYHLQKLRLLSATTNARNIYNHPSGEADGILPAPTAEELSRMDFGPLSHAYVLAIRMFREDHGSAHFPELLHLLKTLGQECAPLEAMELYGYALNFCIWNINLGRLEYLDHLSSLYNQLLDNKLILERGLLLPQQFKNIVALNCRLGKLEWVGSFMEKYACCLPEENREFALQYNRAVLAFHEQDYPRSIQGFREVIATLTDDVFYGLDARAYLWKSYFEHFAHLTMDEVDEMYRLYDAFRLFIERNEKISAAHKLHYRNFIRAFKRFMEILRVRPLRLDHLLELRAEVEGTDSFSNKSWMLEKIDLTLKERT